MDSLATGVVNLICNPGPDTTGDLSEFGFHQQGFRFLPVPDFFRVVVPFIFLALIILGFFIFMGLPRVICGASLRLPGSGHLNSNPTKARILPEPVGQNAISY
jgi:hypothetical protein